MLVWAVVACAVWLVTLSSITLPELCFAAGASIPCGVLAHAARRSLGASWRFRPGWVRWPFPVFATLLAELGQLFRLAVTDPRPGRMVVVELPEEDEQLAAGRQAAATLAMCSTPGSLVAHGEPEHHRLVVHQLLSAGPDLESMVRR
jgi:hypothetical protein